MIWFKHSYNKLIIQHSKRIYDSAQKGTDIFYSMCQEYEGATSSPKDLNGNVLMKTMAEFVYVLLYTTDSRIAPEINGERRYEVITDLLRTCSDLIVREHVPHWQPEEKEVIVQNFLNHYSVRSKDYRHSDQLMFKGDDSIFSNYLYVFGKIVAKLNGRDEDLRLIMIASRLVVDATKGANPFQGLKLDSFAKSIT